MKEITTDKPFAVFSLEADRDYLLARLIAFSGSGFAPRAGYFAQQACEKYLKAFSVQKCNKYLKTHDLIELSRYASEFDRKFADHAFINKLNVFDDFKDVGRYGGEATYDPHSKKEKEFETSGVFIWEVGHIEILDEIVFSIRKQLDFKAIGWSDSLQSVLNDDHIDMLFSTWKLPIPLLDILTTGNHFFKKK